MASKRGRRASYVNTTPRVSSYRRFEAKILPFPYRPKVVDLDFMVNGSRSPFSKRAALALSSLMLLDSRESYSSILPRIVDARRFSPVVDPRAQSLVGTPMPLTFSRASSLSSVARSSTSVRTAPVPSGVGYAVPSKTIVCVRRTVRKQVLLAKGLGGGRHKPPRFNSNSGIDC
jgi:hypothetical protein